MIVERAWDVVLRAEEARDELKKIYAEHYAEDLRSEVERKVGKRLSPNELLKAVSLARFDPKMRSITYTIPLTGEDDTAITTLDVTYLVPMVVPYAATPSDTAEYPRN